MLTCRAILLLGLLANPLAAQEIAAPDDEAQAAAEKIGACLEQPPVTDDPASCIGVIAESCLSGADGTVDNALRCFAGETAGWQLRLDTVLATLHDDAAAGDAAQAIDGAERPSRVTALDRAQAAWLAWRDAECDWHGLGFDPETAAVATAECRRDAIADRVLRLAPRSAAVDGP